MRLADLGRVPAQIADDGHQRVLARVAPRRDTPRHRATSCAHRAILVHLRMILDHERVPQVLLSFAATCGILAT